MNFFRIKRLLVAAIIIAISLTGCDLDLPADKSNVPYMFFINDTKTTKHTLVIDPNSLDLLQEYIQTLSKKYCNY